MNQDNQEDEHDLKWKDGVRKKLDPKGKDASQRGRSSLGYTGRSIGRSRGAGNGCLTRERRRQFRDV